MKKSNKIIFWGNLSRISFARLWGMLVLINDFLEQDTAGDGESDSNKNLHQTLGMHLIDTDSGQVIQYNRHLRYKDKIIQDLMVRIRVILMFEPFNIVPIKLLKKLKLYELKNIAVDVKERLYIYRQFEKHAQKPDDLFNALLDNPSIDASVINKIQAERKRLEIYQIRVRWNINKKKQGKK